MYYQIQFAANAQMKYASQPDSKETYVSGLQHSLKLICESDNQ